VTPVPDVARFERHQVVFTDGRTAEPDLVILATGYLPTFDFMPPEVMGADSAGRPKLALQMFSRTHPTLAIAGLVQPDSGIFTIVHWQTVLMAKWLRLLDAAPGRAAVIWAGIRADADRRFTDARMKDSTRHWFEINHVLYLRVLEKTLNAVEGRS
jgi:hypothetical protein